MNIKCLVITITNYIYSLKLQITFKIKYVNNNHTSLKKIVFTYNLLFPVFFFIPFIFLLSGFWYMII